MHLTFGRAARALLLIGGIAIAGASFAAAPAAPDQSTRVAFAAPAMDNDNNDDPTDDNSEDRILRGQVLEIHEDLSPPEMLVATTDETVWVRVYNEQLPRSGVRPGDHVRLQGEYTKGVFDAYEVDVQDRCCPPPGNTNDND